MTDDAPDATATGRWRWLLGGIAVLVAIGGLLPDVLDWHGNLFDDAYIYLRYAQHNLDGCVLQWNCGAGRVEGFTSPLYLALLTVLGAVGTDLESAASWLGVITWFIALGGFVLLPVALGQRLDRQDAMFPAGAAGILIALTFAGDQLLAINIASGMEGGLVALALLGLAWFSFDPARLAIVAPFMVLVRPELGLGTLLQPVLGRDHLRRAAIGAFVVFSAVTAVRLAVFSDVLPNTFWAKSGGSADHLASGARYVAAAIARFPTTLLVLVGLFSARRALRYLALLVLGWILYFLWSGGDFYPYARLFAFLVPLAGFVGVVAAIDRLQRVQRLGRRGAIIAVTAAVVLLTAGGRLTRDEYAGGEAAFTNVRTWAATGTWLRKCLPGRSIAAVPIGALAYFSGAPVYDMVGLTDPVVAIDGERASGHLFLVGHERAHPRWTLSLEPAVVFVDVRSNAPIDSSQHLDLMYAEGKLLGEIAAQGLPYVSVSAPVRPGTYQLLFVRREVAERELDPACLQSEFRSK